jgi:CRISPR/Cas system CMR subunit Cmr4 (Cas7 group RAMP superfamily)
VHNKKKQHEAVVKKLAEHEQSLSEKQAALEAAEQELATIRSNNIDMQSMAAAEKKLLQDQITLLYDEKETLKEELGELKKTVALGEHVFAETKVRYLYTPFC